MKYKVSSNTQDYMQSTTVRQSNFGGWLAVNTGTANAEVNGYVLAPGEGLDFLQLDPSVIWDSPITINLTATGSKIRLTRLKYVEVK